MVIIPSRIVNRTEPGRSKLECWTQIGTKTLLILILQRISRNLYSEHSSFKYTILHMLVRSRIHQMYFELCTRIRGIWRDKTPYIFELILRTIYLIVFSTPSMYRVFWITSILNPYLSINLQWSSDETNLTALRTSGDQEIRSEKSTNLPWLLYLSKSSQLSEIK